VAKCLGLASDFDLGTFYLNILCVTLLRMCSFTSLLIIQSIEYSFLIQHELSGMELEEGY
jgi:hypothetical protein